MYENFYFFLSGCGAGFLGALLGVGGGLLLIPCLTLVLHVPIKEAVCTSLLSVMASSCAVSKGKIKKNLVILSLATIMESVSILTGLLGAGAALAVSHSILMKIFSFLCFTIAGSMIFLNMKDALQKSNPKHAEQIIGGSKLTELAKNEYYINEETNEIQTYRVENRNIVIILNGISGFLSGLLGIGGGVINVPSMIYVGKIPIKVATATSSYIMGLTSWGSGLYFILGGQVNLPLSVMVILGVFAGAWFGVRYFGKVDSKVLEVIFAVFLFTMGVQMWLK